MPRWPQRTEEERFWEKVDKNGPFIVGHEDLGQCYLWTGSLSDGYGTFMASTGAVKVHKWLWIKINGLVEANLHTDHLCHTYDLNCSGGKYCIHRSCVNVLHMELVTQAENNRRGRGNKYDEKTHCINGHPFDDLNTYWTPGTNRRACLTCARIRQRGYYLKENPDAVEYVKVKLYDRI